MAYEHKGSCLWPDKKNARGMGVSLRLTEKYLKQELTCQDCKYVFFPTHKDEVYRSGTGSGSHVDTIYVHVDHYYVRCRKCPSLVFVYCDGNSFYQ